ncbi:sn-glycerol-1-phosphate dehydrogenase [Catenisphaera adipataccumulans]|uniref:Glycerol-1-phosphate dehydrogenase [NAD(P)+] n=1 Tax=Catenisphaera adipataccumulans TaxID=700500 RepID=A0A7W8CWA1_9FIRM|nr:sn-glycerol-1-phosphate dehydrogenase [Catenisphaera adipataccumulans]MBB5182787.1 glycerol-1-phosphate dehydrogenase [NAD(P)+] [Catenisphaera adipataccumulans]
MKINVDTFQINDYLGHDFDCDCGKVHTTNLEIVKIKENVKEDILTYLKEHNYHTIYMIEDKNTKKAYGEELEDFLRTQSFEIDKVVLTGNVVPDEKTVFQILVNLKRPYDYILGVGSGTLNDLSKFTSKKLNLNYGIVATAPSMDGFASVGAALITDDLKTTYDCHVPTAIFGDLDVLAAAPMEMIKAGLGDIVGKYNCLIDWKIAHVITGEYYCPTIVKMVYQSIHKVVANADGVLKRDKQAILSITEALIETGMAMGFVGNSRPASGSEHHVSHYWEMKLLFAHREPVFHGIKVGLATPGVIFLWHELMKEDLDFDACKEKVRAFDKEKWTAEVKEKFEGAADGVISLEEKAGKNNIEKAVERIDVIASKWEEIHEIIDQELPSSQTVVDILKSVEAPYRPSQVGLDDQLTKDALVYAKEVRVRYGLLQLLWDLGLLEDYSTKFVEYYKNN